MTLLYIMTFGTFSGLSAQFGLLMANLYGAGNPAIVEGAGATAKLRISHAASTAWSSASPVVPASVVMWAMLAGIRLSCKQCLRPRVAR